MWHDHRSPVAVLRVQRDWTSLLEDPDFMVQYQTILEALRRIFVECEHLDQDAL